MCVIVGSIIGFLLTTFTLVFIVWLSLVKIIYRNEVCSSFTLDRNNISYVSHVTNTTWQPDSRLKLNHFTVLGSHNSYHKWSLIHKYEHDMVDIQFRKGIRQIELDIHLMDNYFLIYHLQLIDDRTNCYCLVECLTHIERYLRRASNPYPVYVFFEIKQLFYEDLYTGLSSGVKCTHFEQLVKQILQVFSIHALVQPGLVQSNFSSISEALKRQRQDELNGDYAYKNFGWPSVRDIQGKLIPVFLDDIHQISRHLYDRCEYLRNFFFIAQSHTDVSYASIIQVKHIDDLQHARRLAILNGNILRMLLPHGNNKNYENYQLIPKYSIHILSTDSFTCDHDDFCKQIRNDFTSSTIRCNTFSSPRFCNTSLSYA